MNKDFVGDARRRYAIERWSEGYFDIDTSGRMCARPLGPSGAQVALADVIASASSEGLRLPLLIRFPQILASRAQQLVQAFDNAIEQLDYAGRYTAVYPIKVNQQATVVRTLSGVDGLGLEVGSKPELMTALAVGRPGSILICNGYKDAAYIRLALSG
jgi:arginine decarboxylase